MYISVLKNYLKHRTTLDFLSYTDIYMSFPKHIANSKLCASQGTLYLCKLSEIIEIDMSSNTIYFKSEYIDYLYEHGSLENRKSYIEAGIGCVLDRNSKLIHYKLTHSSFTGGCSKMLEDFDFALKERNDNYCYVVRVSSCKTEDRFTSRGGRIGLISAENLHDNSEYSEVFIRGSAWNIDKTCIEQLNIPSNNNSTSNIKANITDFLACLSDSLAVQGNLLPFDIKVQNKLNGVVYRVDRLNHNTVTLLNDNYDMCEKEVNLINTGYELLSVKGILFKEVSTGMYLFNCDKSVIESVIINNNLTTISLEEYFSSK